VSSLVPLSWQGSTTQWGGRRWGAWGVCGRRDDGITLAMAAKALGTQHTEVMRLLVGQLLLALKYGTIRVYDYVHCTVLCPGLSHA
jgi:hypothetical protein